MQAEKMGNQMKKSIIFFMTIVLCFGMVACGGQQSQRNQGTTAPATTAATEKPTNKNSSIKVDYTDRYLGLHRTLKVDTSVTVPKGESASKQLTWASSDDSIVQVTKSGWLKAQGNPGTAKVEIRADNGDTKTLNITVDDFANPATFSNLEQVKKMNAKAVDILGKYKETICKVATYLEKYKFTEYTLISYYDQKIQVSGKEFDINPIATELKLLTKNADMTVSIYRETMTFGFDVDDISYVIVYSDDNRKSTDPNVIQLAPCWRFVKANRV